MIVDSLPSVLLNKRPKVNDAFKRLQRKSAAWDDIGRTLGISLNYREELRNKSVSNNYRLESILSMWLEDGGESSTWEQLTKALEELHFNDVASEIKKDAVQ